MRDISEFVVVSTGLFVGIFMIYMKGRNDAMLEVREKLYQINEDYVLVKRNKYQQN